MDQKHRARPINKRCDLKHHMLFKVDAEFFFCGKFSTEKEKVLFFSFGAELCPVSPAHVISK